LRTKAEAEAGIRTIGYPSYTIVRPSLIDAEREVPRPAELIAIFVASIFRPLIPSRYQAVKAEWIARALVEAILRNLPGETIIESEQLRI
jgi:hypothetical protein